MKHYIFLSIITGSGGMQCYVAAKAKYLEKQGWHVVVISGNNPKSGVKCQINYLNKFLSNGIPLLGFHPCQLPRLLVTQTLNKMRRKIGSIIPGDEVIIESWNSPTALWGELLASKIHARHVFLTGGESYRNEGETGYKLFEEKIEFYKFKMDRGEIFTTVLCANRLFEGYRHYKKGDFTECVITEEPIQDVDCPQIDTIVKSDWNICYIGRSNKPYVPNIYKGIGLFAQKHKDKKIQFIVVGEVVSNRDRLQELKDIPNLIITELGDLYPLPRSLYTKTDVIIAGSGSARHSADEGALVIIADSEQNNSHGILGYDTNESVYSENRENSDELNISFDEALERALIKQTWRSQPNIWEKNPGVNECTELQFSIIAKAMPELVYYDENKILQGKKTYLILLRSIRANLIVNIKALLKK